MRRRPFKSCFTDQRECLRCYDWPRSRAEGEAPRLKQGLARVPWRYGSGAPKGPRNGNYKHGRYVEAVAATRRRLREITQMLRELNKHN